MQPDPTPQSDPPQAHSAAPADAPVHWPGPQHTLGAGAAIQTLGEYWEEATRNDWEAQWADLTPSEYSILSVVRLLSLNRGREKAFIPDPWRKLLAQCCCLEWKNLKPHFDALVFSKRILRVLEVGGGAELTLLRRSEWKAVRTRGGLTARMRALRAVSQIVEGNKTLQLLLALPPIPLPTPTPETQACKRFGTPTPESQYSPELFSSFSAEKQAGTDQTTPETQASMMMMMTSTSSSLVLRDDDPLTRELDATLFRSEREADTGQRLREICRAQPEIVKGALRKFRDAKRRGSRISLPGKWLLRVCLNDVDQRNQQDRKKRKQASAEARPVVSECPDPPGPMPGTVEYEQWKRTL